MPEDRPNPPELPIDAVEAAELDCPSTLQAAHSAVLFRSLKGAVLSNKNDLVVSVAEATGLSKADAGRAVDAVFDAITDALKAGEEVRLVGFGTFTVSERAASEGRNPRTGEKIAIAASKQPKFKPGKGLKDAIQ
jgi:DNA-binding protein HU-beta